MTLHIDPSKLITTPGLAFKSADAITPEGSITGYGSAFGGPPDAQGHIIAPGAFAKSLAQHRAEGSVPSMLWTHSGERVIGKWQSVVEDHYGLSVVGRLNLNTKEGREAFQHLSDGDLNGLSIGYFAKDGRLDDDGKSIVLTEIDLIEISVVHAPANRRARVTSVKSIESRREYEDVLREIGFAKGAAKKLASRGWSGLMGDEPSEGCSACGKSHEEVEQMIEWRERSYCLACASGIGRKGEAMNLPTQQIADALRASTAKWRT